MNLAPTYFCVCVDNSVCNRLYVSQETATIQSPVDKLDGLDELVNKALKTFHVPGAAIGVIIDGKVVLTKGYGLSDQSNNPPATENTLFAIGSCTKAFTTHVLG